MTADRPKALIEVGGRPLIEYALEGLKAAGFERFIAVTGHAAEKLDSYPVEQVFNDRWETDNNIVSLWQVRDRIRDGCLIVNCDTLFDPRIAVAIEQEWDTSLVVDDQLRVDAESMKVVLDDEGELQRLHKSVELDAAVGEYIGLARVAPAHGEMFAEVLDEFVQRGETQVYYEDALEELARRVPVGVTRIGGLPWVEIDDEVDLARANSVVLPQLAPVGAR